MMTSSCYDARSIHSSLLLYFLLVFSSSSVILFLFTPLQIGKPGVEDEEAQMQLVCKYIWCVVGIH